MRYINYSLQLKCKYRKKKRKTNEERKTHTACFGSSAWLAWLGSHVWAKLSICSAVRSARAGRVPVRVPCPFSVSGFPTAVVASSSAATAAAAASFPESQARMIYNQKRVLFASPCTESWHFIDAHKSRRLAAIKTACPQGHALCLSLSLCGTTPSAAHCCGAATLVICLLRLACEKPEAAKHSFWYQVRVQVGSTSSNKTALNLCRSDLWCQFEDQFAVPSSLFTVPCSHIPFRSSLLDR